jgi:hypothetical protein
MQAMADGLAGHQLDFYPYVNDSHWLHSDGSGSDYSGLNEALPYWMNGIVPLAYTLGDARLIDQVGRATKTILGLQSADGWLGPEPLGSRNLWGRFPFLLGLVSLADADSAATDAVVGSLRSFLNLTHSMLQNNGEGYSRCPGFGEIDCSWGQVRSPDLMITIQWLLENHPSKNSTDDLPLYETLDMLYSLSKYKWDEWYQPSVYQKVVANPTPENPYFPYLHGVNAGQGLKASAVVRRFTHTESLVQSSWDAVNWTFTYHGAPSGTILGDEIQRDLASYMGSEFCTVVETAYSLGYLYHALGNNAYAEQAELITFNAMPVTMTDDLWGHQYVAQVNQPWALNMIDKQSFFTNSNGAAASFGLEPNYPCCTVNHHQGYPKFLVNSWARAETGLVHALLSPSTVDTDINGAKIHIECQTNYPFENILTYSVTADAPFDLFLRLPSWADASQSTVTFGSVSTAVSPDSTTGLHRISLPKGQSTVRYGLNLPLRTEPRPNGAVSVYVGNVLYSLDLEPNVTTSLPHRYWDYGGKPTTQFSAWPNVHDTYFNATTPWNVAIDPDSLKVNAVDNSNLQTRAFKGPWVGQYVSVRGCEIDWPLLRNMTPDVPPTKPKCKGKPATFRMIPYGIAKAHMSELPVVDLTMSFRVQ